MAAARRLTYTGQYGCCYAALHQRLEQPWGPPIGGSPTQVSLLICSTTSTTGAAPRPPLGGSPSQVRLASDMQRNIYFWSSPWVAARRFTFTGQYGRCSMYSTSPTSGAAQGSRMLLKNGVRTKDGECLYEREGNKGVETRNQGKKVA